MKVQVTDAAKFIGMHVAAALLERGDIVVGIDNLNDCYDPKLKRARLEQLKVFPSFRLMQADIADADAMEELFAAKQFNRVANLAAEAGARDSLKNSRAYIQPNLVGIGNILECCRHHGIEHLLYAS